MSANKSTPPADMSQTKASEVPMSVSGLPIPQNQIISPTTVRKKPVPYLDVPILGPESISLSAVMDEKATDPFADPEPSSTSGPLKNPFDDPKDAEAAPDVSKLAVLPAAYVERRYSDESVVSYTSTGAPKKYGIAL
ncbi:hypothetical protein C0992_011655 [Termitomyces sp. T32_za158]|nr:hypothetical protein C0992_011655 [Termitomyces sp. T32_za158]